MAINTNDIKSGQVDIKVEMDAEEALEQTRELVDLMDEISPSVVIRGAKDCTFNIYHTVYKVIGDEDGRENDN